MTDRLRLGATVLALVLAAVIAGPARAQGADGAAPAAGAKDVMRFPVQGLPDIVLPRMDPARGRTYFATRACVVCHSVNGVGGTTGPSLDYENGTGTMAPLDFVSRMWRGGRSMLALQEALFGETIDLTPEEIGDIMAFLHDPAQKKLFSERDIPKFIRDFMTGREGAGQR